MNSVPGCVQRFLFLVCEKCTYPKTLLLSLYLLRNLPFDSFEVLIFPKIQRYSYIITPTIPRQPHTEASSTCCYCITPLGGALWPHHTTLWSDFLSRNMWHNVKCFWNYIDVIFCFYWLYPPFCSQRYCGQGRCGNSLVSLNATQASSTIFFCLDWLVL